MEVVAEADSLYEEALTSILANSPLVMYWFVSLLVTIPLKVTTFFLISKLLDASAENGNCRSSYGNCGNGSHESHCLFHLQTPFQPFVASYLPITLTGVCVHSVFIL